MIFAALMEAAGKGELILVDDGLCRWHLRKDGVVVIREILVCPWSHQRGIGRRMLEMVMEKNPDAPIVAKCPALYEANLWWKLLGFREINRTEKLIEWRMEAGEKLRPSAGAPTGTSLTLVPPSPPGGCTGSDSPPKAC